MLQSPSVLFLQILVKGENDMASLSILYVDDEPALLEIRKLFLERSGDFAVTTCACPLDAIKILSTKHFDAVISDYQMPEMDGIQLLQHHRQHGNTTPFVIFTGKGREEVVIEALNSGADFYIQKGGSPKPQFAELGNKIKYAVARRRAEEALKRSEERYRRISENVPVGIFQFVMAPAGEFFLPYMSSKAMEIVGVPVEDASLSFAAVRDRIHPDYQDAFDAGVLESAEKLKDFHQTFLYFAEDGSRWLEVRSTPSEQPDGSILWEGVIIDIDQQKRAEEELQRTNDELSAANQQLTTVQKEVRQQHEERAAIEEEIRQQLDDLAVAHQKLQESEVQFRRLFESMDEGMALHELIVPGEGEPHEYRILAANPSFERILGIDRDSIIGKLSRDAYGTDEPPYLHIYTRVARTGIPESFETYFPPLDKHFRISVYSPRKNQFATIFEDITERKQVEEALRQSEEKFRNLLENLNEVFYILDENATITYVSRNIESIGGYPASEVIGRPYLDLVHPDDRAGRLLQFRSILSGSNGPTEYRFLKADGGSVWVKTAARPILRDGRVVGIQGMLTDITGLKTMEGALRESEGRYRDLAENAPIGILTCDTGGCITYVNQWGVDLLGSPGVEETLRVNLLTFPPLVQTGFADLLQKTMDSRMPFAAVDGEYCTKWGKNAYYRAHISPILNQKTVTGARIILDDISEHKKAENALNTVNKKLQLLSGITRHDILNQIMAVQGYLEFAEEMSVDTVQAGHLEKVKKAAAAIQRQIEFTREYEQLGVKEPAWLSLGDLIEKIGDTHLSLSCDCPGISIYADPMIERVFLNLMDNTVRHAEGATCVQVRCSKAGSCLLIVWEDDGSGVPDDQKERIFKRGYGKNSGFGLFLSREILGITGITIVESGLPGKGARFDILVPEGGYRIA
jgi:PAS domain S-box-containing protein